MKTKKVLIVDDDIDVINVVDTILSKQGYNVIPAGGKTEAMEKIKTAKPDLAILDVMMTTHYEGFELAKDILDDPEIGRLPVIIQTSIEVLTTTRHDVKSLAAEFRKNPEFRELHVILIRNTNTGEAGVDYLSEEGNTIWFPTDGFLHKPVDPQKLTEEIKRIIG